MKPDKPTFPAPEDAARRRAASHSSDEAACAPLLVEIFAPAPGALKGWTQPPVNGYGRSHGA